MNNNFDGTGSLKEKKAVIKNIVRSVIETVKEPLLILDSKMHFVKANPGLYAALGIKNEKILISELKSDCFEGLKNILNTELPLNESVEDLALIMDLPQKGTEKFLINANYLTDESSGLILISFKSIENQEKSVNKSQDDLENFHDIFSQAPAMICILKGPEHIFELANENYFQLVGHRDIIGKTVREALPEVKGQGFFEMLDGVYNSSEAFIGNELPVKLDVGEKQLKNSFVDFVYQPILDASENVNGIFVHAVDVTEKVLGRKKIEESENELRNLIDTVPAIIWITKPDGSLHYLNKNWYEYTGQTVEDSGNFGWLMSIHPAERKTVETVFMNANEKKEVFHTNFRLRSKNGAYRWSMVNGSPKFNVDGEYEGMVGIVIDVHEEKMKEELIREKEHRIRSIIEEATVATALYTGRGMKIEIANDAMIELWGKDHSVIGATLHEALPELEGQPFHDLLQQVFTTGETYWGKEDPVDLMIGGKLQTGYFNFTYKALRDENGDIYGILNMAIDVTEIVKSKELLKESESRFRQMADLMPEKVANTDANGNFIYEVVLTNFLKK